MGSSFFKNNVIQESSRTVPENFFKKLQESLTTGVQAVLEKHMILKVILTFSVIKIVHTLFLPYRLFVIMFTCVNKLLHLFPTLLAK